MIGQLVTAIRKEVLLMFYEFKKELAKKDIGKSKKSDLEWLDKLDGSILWFPPSKTMVEVDGYIICLEWCVRFYH